MTKKDERKGHCELCVLAAMTSWHVSFQLQRKQVDDYTADFVPIIDRYGASLYLA